MGANGWLGHEDFAGREGETFTLALPDGGELRLVLGGASLLGHAGGPGPDGATREQFSLLFLGPPEPTLAQATWPLRHDVLGALEVFLVPLGPSTEGMRYEAVFA